MVQLEVIVWYMQGLGLIKKNSNSRTLPTMQINKFWSCHTTYFGNHVTEIKTFSLGSQISSPDQHLVAYLRYILQYPKAGCPRDPARTLNVHRNLLWKFAVCKCLFPHVLQMVNLEHKQRCSSFCQISQLSSHMVSDHKSWQRFMANATS